MKIIIPMLTGIMSMLIAIFVLIIGYEGAALFFAIVGILAFLFGAAEGLYGMKRSPKPSPEVQIAQVVCQKCGKKYDMDYPRCPHCGQEQE